MRRREFITVLGGAVAWPLAARAQQPALPVVGLVLGGSFNSRFAAGFRKGLNETGYVEGQNVMVEEHWLAGQYDRLPALMSDLVRRHVAVIASPDSAPAALAATAATTTIPIVFGVGEDPVKLGLVASLARPGGNATGVNFFTTEVAAKRLSLLHELVPTAVRIALLINPANSTSAEAASHDIPEAARAYGLQSRVFKASTGSEIDTAFADLVREGCDAVLMAPDAFLASRTVQIVNLEIHYGIPSAHSGRDFSEAGALMSYGTNIADTYRQGGNYAGRILRGTKPDDLPVLQVTKFEFVINLHTAKLLGLNVSPSLLARADEVIE